MKEKLFEQLDREFRALCEFPTFYMASRFVNEIIFLLNAGVIDTVEYRFLYDSCSSVFPNIVF